MTEDEQLRNELRRIIEKAREALDWAETTLAAGHHGFASSRAYYAVFYAMQAALLSKKLARSKHSGVISAFNLHLVKPGVFPPHFGALISQLFSRRNVGDYQFGVVLSDEDVKEDLAAAEEIVQAITAYLIRDGFIESGDVKESTP